MSATQINLGGADSPIEPWRETLTIHSYDVDWNRQASPHALGRLFLESAWNHAEQLGVGYAALAASHKVWVLSRLLIEFSAFPSWQDTVRLSTWPRGIESLFALRDFRIENETGQTLVVGTSSWLILDAASRRPQRLDKILNTRLTLPNSSVVGRNAEKLKAISLAQQTRTFTAAYSDIDLNQHANSAVYIAWLMDAFDERFHREHVLKRLELNYTGETHWGEALTLNTQMHDGLISAHSLTGDKAREVCRALLTWSTRNR